MRIFLLEDSPEDVRMIERLLKRIDSETFELTVRNSLSEAEACLKKNHAFDLVLCDMFVADCQGMPTIERVLEFSGEATVIVLTGYDDENSGLEALRIGVQDYLSKRNLTASALHRAMRHARERKLLADKLLASNRRLEEAMEELKEAQASNVRNERLKAIGQMASGIAHDFNNTLTPILANADYFLTFPEELQNQEEALRIMREIKTCAEDAATVVRRLRYSYGLRETNGELRPLELGAVLEEVVGLTRPIWRDTARRNGKSIEVRVSKGADALIRGDIGEIREMFMNLVMNSVDAIDKVGEIRLAARRVGDHVEVIVEDDGAGMPEEIKSVCFEPFVTTKGDRGTGLGLSSVFESIQRHDGTVSVESAPGQGARFVARFPYSEAKSDAEGSSVCVEKDASMRVLLVDDEELVRDAMGRLLRYSGYECESAPNAASGLELARSGRFDLVITDRAMPGMNGDELASQIKLERPHTPVVMLTGYSDVMQANGEAPACVDYMLSKPFSIESVKQCLNAVTRN